MIRAPLLIFHLFEQTLSFVGASAASGTGLIECSDRAQVVIAQQGPSHIRFSRSAWRGSSATTRPRTWSTFISSVVYSASQPSGWIFSEVRRRWPSVADDGPRAVAAPVAEPLDEDLLAGDFVLPHFRLHVVDEAAVPIFKRRVAASYSMRLGKCSGSVGMAPALSG